MSEKQKQLIEYATQDLVSFVSEREGRSAEEAMGVVYHSELYAKLLDPETELYLEGSEYLYGLLKEERGIARVVRWMKIDDIQIEAVAKNNLFAMSIYAFGLSFDSETRQFVDGKVEKIA